MVNFLLLMLCYSYIRCYHWEKLVKEDTEPLLSNSTTSFWIGNYLKINKKVKQVFLKSLTYKKFLKVWASHKYSMTLKESECLLNSSGRNNQQTETSLSLLKARFVCVYALHFKHFAHFLLCFGSSHRYLRYYLN